MRTTTLTQMDSMARRQSLVGGGAPDGGTAFTKAQILHSLEKVRNFVLEYGEMLETVQSGASWKEKVAHKMGEHANGINAQVVTSGQIALIFGLVQYFLDRLQQDSLHFKVPTQIGLLPEIENQALINLSRNVREWEKPIDLVVADVQSLVESVDHLHREKAEALIHAISSLFKGLLRQDWNDVNLFLSHLNLVTTTRESGDLVDHIAKIAREIYNSLNEFSEGFSIETLSESTVGIPDAVVKLKSVISRLEDAANTNLDQLEKLGRENAEHQQYIDESQKIVIESTLELDRLMGQHPELKEKLVEIKEIILSDVNQNLQELQRQTLSNSNEILGMVSNQGFQDLTGQTLKRVIDFVESLQSHLIELLQKYSKDFKHQKSQAEAEPVTKPAPKSQDEVDKLLADLGF